MNKLSHKIIKILLVIYLTGFCCFAESKNNHHVVLVPSSESFNGRIVFETLKNDDWRWEKLVFLFDSSFLNEIVFLNERIQTYLQKQNRIDSLEPLYLVLSGKQGGYARKGFLLKQETKIVDKSHVHYVELANLESNHSVLASITQILPHEFAHVAFRQLTNFQESLLTPIFSDIHYFSILTNYHIAFDEGLAGAFENIARLYEPSTSIKSGIHLDSIKISDQLPKYLTGYQRDYKWPLRVGFYRMSMVIWYQKFENLKRYTWALNKWAKYKCISVNSKSVSNAILFKNSGISPNFLEYLSPEQQASSEGAINAFFSHLFVSELKERFQPDSFYLHFYQETSTLTKNQLSPLQNQFLKIFWVVDRYVNPNDISVSPFKSFIDGYIVEFPLESETLLAIYEDVMGHAYPNKFGPQVWVYSNNYKHKYWVMSQFSNSLSRYIFNLNTAEPDQLQTINGISRIDAKAIINHRNSKGHFNCIDEIGQIDGLSLKASNALINSEFQLIDNDSEFSLEINSMVIKLFTGIIKRILFYAFVYTLLAGLIYYLIINRLGLKIDVSLKFIIRLFFKFLTFLTLGILLTPFPYPLLLFTVISISFLIIIWSRARRNLVKRKQVIISSLLLYLFIAYSML